MEERIAVQIEALEDADSSIRFVAVVVLGYTLAEALSVIPAFVEVLRKEPDYEVRSVVARSLGDLLMAVAPVNDALGDAQRNDQDGAVRLAAAEALGHADVSDHRDASDV